MTVLTPDKYGGGDLSGKVLYRVSGTSTWNDVTGGSTFNGNPGVTYDIVAGISTSDDEDEPFGPKMTYTVPCEAYPTLEIEMVDDSVEGDVVPVFFDPEDGNSISSSDPLDLDNGDVFSVEFKVQASFEEDYGNRFCPGSNNVVVWKYQTANLTNLKMTDLNGAAYESTGVPTIDTSGASGYTQVAFKLPALQSNEPLRGYLVLDATGAGAEPDGSIWNLTATLYDSNWFINNDKPGAPVECGVQDEDRGDVGSTGADTWQIDFTQGS